jgi:hypothetical protein
MSWPTPPAPHVFATRKLRFLLKFPTRSRPQQFFNVLDRWLALASGRHEITYLITLDEDDETMNTPEVRARLAALPVEAVYGKSASKIEACNRDMEGRSFDILMLASDDMVPQIQGWDNVVGVDMLMAFPDLDGALHYTDGGAFSKKIITFSVMGEALYRKLGYIYHPAYKSVFCDNDFTDVVRRLGKYKWTGRTLARHDHPYNTKSVPQDDLYRRNDAHWAADEATFNARQRANYST